MVDALAGLRGLDAVLGILVGTIVLWLCLAVPAAIRCALRSRSHLH